jgi:hypothetical protein
MPVCSVSMRIGARGFTSKFQGLARPRGPNTKVAPHQLSSPSTSLMGDSRISPAASIFPSHLPGGFSAFKNR